MKRAEVKEERTDDQGSELGLIKLYAQGKIGLLIYGKKKFLGIAEQCSARAMHVLLKFDRPQFEKEMRKHGIPDDVIEEFADNYHLEDEIWLSTDSNWPQ